MMPETTASKVAIAITTKFTHVNIGESVSVGKAKMPYAPRSRMYCVNSTMQIATICDTVFRLAPVVRRDHPALLHRNKADGRHGKFADHNKEHKYRVRHAVRLKQISADITMILSAKGSISLPKFVMR